MPSSKKHIFIIFMTVIKQRILYRHCTLFYTIESSEVKLRPFLNQLCGGKIENITSGIKISLVKGIFRILFKTMLRNYIIISLLRIAYEYR